MTNNLTLQAISDIDKSDMISILKSFPAQVSEAIEIGKNSKGFPFKPVSDNYFVLGMGGSAIGGDLLKSVVNSIESYRHLNIQVVRDYILPGYLNKESNVIASSYSGETEETLTGFRKSSEIAKNIAVISTGGTITKLANEKQIPVVKIPAGMQPRCAIGYSFFPMIFTLINSEVFSVEVKAKLYNDMEHVKESIKAKSELYSSLSDENPALKIANQINGFVPVIYSSSVLETVNLRWRCQIQENAKYLAYGSILPEMNHNEVNSFANPEEIISKLKLIILRDSSDNNRTQIRMDAISEILKDCTAGVIELYTEGESNMERVFNMIYLGDWVSYWLAIVNGTDPTPIPFISKLKNILSSKV